MAKIGERVTLKIKRESAFGVYLNAGELGEVLLPQNEAPLDWVSGDDITVFLYLDSEDRPVATLRTPLAVPGQFARLKCIATSGVGAFLDWGLTKDLLVPFREQKIRMEMGKFYLVYVMIDEESGRVVATTRLARHLNKTLHSFRDGDEVDLTVYEKTPLGYKAIINHTHIGLLFGNEVFSTLRIGEKLKGYIREVRDDGKIDLCLQKQGRERVDDLQSQILHELESRGGFWSLCDASPAEEIHEELGVSKRTFKQALGALFREGKITLSDQGTRLL